MDSLTGLTATGETGTSGEAKYIDVPEAMCYNETVETALYFHYSTTQTVLLTVILPIVLLFGIVGNVLFIYVAIKIPHMRTITNRYLVSLSIADVVFLVAAIGGKIWKYASSPNQFDDTALGSLGCVGLYFFSDVAYFASLIFVTLVSADRFVAVCRPQERHSFIKGRSMEIIGFCWLISGFLSAILTPGNAHLEVYCFKWPDVDTYKDWSPAVAYCMPLKGQMWITSFSNGLQTIPFMITFVVNIVLYVLIIRGLDQCIRRMGQHGVTKSKDAGMRNQIAKMLVVNGIVFFCLLSPFEIQSFFSMIAVLRMNGPDAQYLIHNETARVYLRLVCQLLSYINSAVNPVIYSVMCRRYRQAFREALLPTSCIHERSYKRSGPESCTTGQIQLEQTSPDTKDTNV